MKITFVLAANSVTGGYRAIFELANRMKQRGHEVFIVHPLIPLTIEAPNSIMSMFKKVRSALGNLKRGKDVSWFNLKADMIRVLSLSLRFTELLHHSIPDSDVIVATAWETAYVVNNLPASKGIKAYFVQHYEVWDMWNDRTCWEEAKNISGNIERMPLAMADVAPPSFQMKKIKELVDATYRMPFINITTSEWLKELIEQKYYGRAYRIKLGVNHDDFRPVQPKNSKAKTVLMPLRSAPWKGASDGLQALEIVKIEFPEVQIVLYGEHVFNIPSSLNAQYSGMLSGRKLRELYSSADIFVFPSLVEGWGLPPMEAMACGTACVTTDVGGVSEYAINNKTALIVPPEKPEKLAEAIIDLLQNDEKRNSIAKAGQEHIKKFSWEYTADSFEDILKSSLEPENYLSASNKLHIPSKVATESVSHVS